MNDLLSCINSKAGERQGYLVLNREGLIRQSSGDLKDRNDIAKNVMSMLRDSGDLLGVENGNFRRLCISFEHFQYAVQVSPCGEHIIIVKDKI